MKIYTLIEKLSAATSFKPIVLGPDLEIKSLSVNTDDIQPGSLYICTPSLTRDARQFISIAKSKGAVACVVYDEQGEKIAEQNKLTSTRFSAERNDFIGFTGQLCKTFYDDPSIKMKMIGITGTNGKTTTAWILRHALEKLGAPAAYIGTLGFKTSQEQITYSNTTLFPVELWSLISSSYQKSIKAVVMEVSSQALVEKRLEGLSFDIGCFTNLTQDHLDFHKTMEAYELAKKSFFTDYAQNFSKTFKKVINIDDECGKSWSASWRSDPNLMTFGENANLSYEILHVGLDGIRLRLHFEGKTALFEVPLLGLFNVYNTVAAASCLVSLGYSLEEAAEGLRDAPAVPGRFEPVPNELGIHVLVDYAHAPDALEKLLISAKKLNPKRLLTVFGCGGDRDKTKRPIMAEIVSKYSDISFVTSDNPRTEDPAAIIREVEAGIIPGSKTTSIIDRGEAVKAAIEESKPDDLVIIAGKGHEDYQIIGHEKIHMDDRELARDALISLGAKI